MISECLPTLFIPHGGGPCFFMEDGIGPKGTWDRMAAYLRGIAGAVGQRPKAILVISGHWEEAEPTVQVGRNPPLLFDYYGFPEHTYRLNYPAPGSPELAARVRALLSEAGIKSGEEAGRGFDHGVFIPFLLIYPEADIPVVQLSLRQDLDPAAHIAIGRAIVPLREDGVLIVGSGMSYHNLRYFGSMEPRVVDGAQRFDDWLTAAIEEPDPARRADALELWSTAPDALLCHPRAEHLAPLFVVAGAAGDDRGRRTFNDRIIGKAVSGFQFG
ncbi:MAG TPA: class III extradiol ring-cleavage dioxygenase [Dongiaceae bacterium]|jgi:aromatic ring-opening dioxygenase catalytic subunit (LigB family)|nr:class III extradiol ring-cleavage dioxygenase [Dongiaceae bacterium]